MDKTNPTDWQAVKPKSIVTISDAQGIQDSMRRGLGVRGLDYTVRSVGRCEQLDGLSTHLIFTLDDAEQAAFLLVKIVDDLVALTLYFEPPGLSGGERTGLLERGMQWLFQAPSDPNSFEPDELRSSAMCPVASRSRTRLRERRGWKLDSLRKAGGARSPLIPLLRNHTPKYLQLYNGRSRSPMGRPWTSHRSWRSGESTRFISLRRCSA